MDGRKKILTGSCSFFRGISGFNSKDVDYVIIEMDPKRYKYTMQLSSKGLCKFYWNGSLDKEELISFNLKHGVPMQVVKFLNKEFCDHYGINVDDLKRLEPLFVCLDEKHRYAKTIYDAYVENNGFVMTEEQRQKAYALYLSTRSTTK